ncbi:Gfo/Idh/MocA family protein [Thermodesulfovibrio thiophilus]|uniref:Gfo/Idh/MocA family protein n=1 Tax=Thermodesulfovibrio thiophilus TaxID=340095 RepID=UPI0017ECF74F|nr:Gfo/Idh/MocA family oxidoreductase [Thermodesulfovibrio thiophilus]HHW19544.1 Gfo/Idh/MocA family oxidoreductase [Thermodesulfovibrio thiophilus]
MKFKVAVIGAGYFGQKHIKMLTQMPDVEIVGIVDTDISRAQEIGQKYGLRYYTVYENLLKSADIFFIVTPTITHFDIAMDLIKEKKSIFIEKPLTENPGFAEKIFDEATKHNIIMQVGLIERYNPVMKSLLEYVENPLFIHAERLSPFSGRGIDTDVTYDLMIHDIDLVLMILKKSENLKLTDLKVFTQSIITSKIDYAGAWLEFVNYNDTVEVSLTASRISSDVRRKFSVIQSANVLYADLINKTLVKVDKKGQLTELTVKNKDTHPLYDEIRDFLNSVRQRKYSIHAASPDDIINTIKLIEKINGGTH